MMEQKGGAWMRARNMMAAACLLLLCGCSTSGPFNTANAAGYYNADPIQCVPYARQKSGIDIFGDAHTWWAQAGQKGYAKGNKPQIGSVLVLQKTSKLKHGHVAVVSAVRPDRTIDVSHSNWGSDSNSRSAIYERMRVEDISPNGDWTMVRFWNKDHGVFGFAYPAHGFIYPRSNGHI